MAFSSVNISLPGSWGLTGRNPSETLNHTTLLPEVSKVIPRIKPSLFSRPTIYHHTKKFFHQSKRYLPCSKLSLFNAIKAMIMNNGKAMPLKFPSLHGPQIRNSWSAIKPCSKVWLVKLQYRAMQTLHDPQACCSQLHRTDYTLSLDAVLGHLSLKLLGFWLTTEILLYSHYSFLQVPCCWFALAPFFRLAWHWQKNWQEKYQ